MEHLLHEYTDILRLRGLLISQSDVPCDKPVAGLTFDSREAGKDTLFICKGKNFDCRYLSDAARQGAVAYVSERKYDAVDIPFMLVSNIRKAMPVLASLYFDDAPSRLIKIGITGTKGKTTTAYFIRSVLDSYLKNGTAVISSVQTFDGVVSEESHITTPEAVEFYRHCSNAVSSGITHLVSEVSSQALKYDRVDGIIFDVGVFHNFGKDHISPGEHDSEEDYFRSKLRLFSQCKTALINTGSDRYDEIIRCAFESGCRVVRYGTDKDADYRMSDFRSDDDRLGGSFTVSDPDGNSERVRFSIPGTFNAENALCAYSVCRELGIPRDDIVKGIASARVPGRMEVFDSRDGKVRAIVDYAHNEMSFRSLYESIESDFPGSPIITVFGCPGGKAYQRREDLGKCSGAHSALTVLTEEDPAFESVCGICGEIAAHVEREGGKYLIVPDRDEAIKRAFCEAGKLPGKVVVAITGKGDEEFMKRGGGVEHVKSDVSIVRDFLGV